MDNNPIIWYNKGIDKPHGAVLEHPPIRATMKRIATMPNYTTRTCPICNTKYQADLGRLKHGRQTTCSRKCSYKLRAKMLAGGKEVQCRNCSTVFHTSKKNQNVGFCCIDCYHEYRRKKAIGRIRCKPSNGAKRVYSPRLENRLCLICDKEYHPRKITAKYCSRNCFEISHKETMRGTGNPSYVDGRSYKPTYDAGREWHNIRVEAYIRDNYNCQDCGAKCVSKRTAMNYPEYSKLIIQCHHIVPYDISQDNNLGNLTTLCIVCHRRTHHEMETA